MFSSKSRKKILSIVLIIAMILSSAGMTTFAASLSRVQGVSIAKGEAKLSEALVAGKYYKQVKLNGKTVLLGNDETAGDSLATEDTKVDAGTRAEKSGANENAKAGDDNSSSLSDDENNKNDENKDVKVEDKSATSSDANENKKDKTDYKDCK